MPRTALVSAMTEELHGLQRSLRDARVVRHAGREFWLGELAGRGVVLVHCGIGKVAAATTAAVLLAQFEVDALVFTGAAGGLHAAAQVGDIVIADALAQHDMDASPLFPRHEVPLYGRSRFAADAALTDALQAAAEQALHEATQGEGPHEHGLTRAHWHEFGLEQPRVHRGLVLSGDRFVSRAADSAALREAFPDALAVEMEGAAVAQVCADFGLPFAVLRTVSDRADDTAHVDFTRFIADIASRYSVAVVHALLARDAARTNQLQETSR
jgi:adenosylhomocysteine nucleosidase